MAAETGGQERTEAPTAKKREDSRKEGMVAMSREVSSAALLGAFSLYFMMTGDFNLNIMQALWLDAFARLKAEDLSIIETGLILQMS